MSFTVSKSFPALVSYLEKHTDWSYREFLTLHHDVIVASPPFSDDWYGLDGAWFHRFLRKVKELDPCNFEDLKEKEGVLFLYLFS